ncbi:hypothetical protein PFICI_05215 [Pestalotiopsis fici W106-1]|uniref:Uncharacterized protein n=1 Tax=Pestalotiopsis fici (strain W106-1 / CGMCC3.15140) TaxID=1229662 RepID=W3XBD9_PESFW|nr:uncharacterized protein PFICI_05215 [Pestalotiopsis fici W106-1]ETS83339.1 hypothetical protein PFICI_05215 [Pestalotiopsis fici W106-1]
MATESDMFEALLKASGRIRETDDSPNVVSELAKSLPHKFQLEDLLRNVIAPDHSGDIQFLRALLVCLKSDQLETGLENDQQVFDKIASHVTKSIAPIAPDSDSSERYHYLSSVRWQPIASKGEVGLAILESLQGTYKAKLDPKVLVATTAFTNPQDPWTTQAAGTLAQTILAAALDRPGAKETLITSTILTTFLRPLFSRSRPATVTASGRKAEFVEPARYAGAAPDGPTEAELKPWKYAHAYAVTVFAWAVEHANQDLLAAHWHLFTPVLLTLLDEARTDVKVRAMRIFSAFWARCPPGLMARVGLANVFEQAIFPAVLFLPTLTPEDESIRILNVAYPALFQIAGLPYPENVIGEPVKQPEFTEAQRKMLDTIIRQGLLVGYHHANEHIRLTELFCNKATSIVNGMGILSVKHLKNLLPMVAEIMTEPFGTKYPPALLAANQLIQTIMRCCWPRIGCYGTEIIRILTTCYLHIEDEDSFPSGSPSKEDLKTALSKTTGILAKILENEMVLLSETVSPLVEKEPLLADLFTSAKIHPSAA